MHRIYEHDRPPAGRRVLVDRLWPRGVTRADAALDDWAKDLAPSHELRRWYGHDPQRFDEFARRYCRELRRADSADGIVALLDSARHGGLVLLTATRDVEHSGARVLQHHLLDERQTRSS